MKFRPAALTRLLLLAFLFAVQSLAVAHQVDHVANSEAGNCAVCVAGAHLGHAAVDSAPEPVETSTPAPFCTFSAENIEARALPTQRARAPPLS
ncbi:MAG: hypothetical protein PVI83_00780 [Lysobacterales bacterium]|jgi:hypothetical protein